MRGLRGLRISGGFWADWATGADGAMGADRAMGAEGAMGAEEDKGASIYTLLDGQDTIGIRYMALWGFGANCRVMGDG